jgi:hypothetical protein
MTKSPIPIEAEAEVIARQSPKLRSESSGSAVLTCLPPPAGTACLSHLPPAEVLLGDHHEALQWHDASGIGPKELVGLAERPPKSVPICTGLAVQELPFHIVFVQKTFNPPGSAVFFRLFSTSPPGLL